MDVAEKTFGTLESRRKSLVSRNNELWFQDEMIGCYTRPLLEGTYRVQLHTGKRLKLKRVGRIVSAYYALLDQQTKVVLATTENDIELSVGKCYWYRPDYGDMSLVTLNRGEEVIAEFESTGKRNGNWLIKSKCELPLADLILAGLLYDMQLRASRDG